MRAAFLAVVLLSAGPVLAQDQPPPKEKTLVETVLEAIGVDPNSERPVTDAVRSILGLAPSQSVGQEVTKKSACVAGTLGAAGGELLRDTLSGPSAGGHSGLGASQEARARAIDGALAATDKVVRDVKTCTQ